MAEFVWPDWLPTAPELPPPPVDADRIEGLTNRFIAASQDTLHGGPDALFGKSGADAVEAAPVVAAHLSGLRATLDLARDEPERQALADRLERYHAVARDDIDRHVAEQRQGLARQVIADRQALNLRAAGFEHNEDVLPGLAEAHAQAAQALARLDGMPEESAMQAARSAVWRGAIDQRLADGEGARALGLFEQAKDTLVAADQHALEVPMEAARTDIAADQWIKREAGKDGEPLATRLQADTDLSPAEKATALAKIEARDSAQESARVATVKGLDDRFGATTGTLATQPAAYKPGTLAAIANGYEDAGEADKADSARRMALQESFLRSFATSNVSAQQRLTESLPEGEDRTSAEAIQRRQTEAFAQDPFTAGTALYPDVGPPKPINELAGRIAQARTIAAYRSIPVAPFTANELATLRQKLVDGTPQERAALLAQLDALPEDMNAAIIPARTMSDAVDESRREGDQLAEATPEDFREIGPPPRRGAAPVIEPSPGSPEFEAATDEARKITTKRGVAPPVEPAPDSLEFQTAMTKAVGHPVVLPDGSRVPDPTSDTGNLMSPEPDLRAVAEAGRKAGEQYRALIDNPETADGATAYLAITAGLNVGQGGSFDYQREGNHITGFEQLPHFRNVSNFNVGLFCQQAGLTLDETLKVAGKFARMFSRNYDPSQPYGLNKQTAEFTTRGFKTGESGVFDRTNPP